MNTFLLVESKNYMANFSIYFWAKTQDDITFLSSNFMVATLVSAY